MNFTDIDKRLQELGLPKAHSYAKTMDICEFVYLYDADTANTASGIKNFQRHIEKAFLNLHREGFLDMQSVSIGDFTIAVEFGWLE